MKDRWSTELSQKSYQQLNKFYMVLQELHQELSVAKPLGICKTCISTNPVLNSSDLDLISKNGKNGTELSTRGKGDLKVTL